MNKPSLVELVDIIGPSVPPPAPPSYGWIIVGVALGLLAVVSLVFWWHRHRHTRAALRQLKRTERALSRHQINPRAAVFQTVKSMRLADPGSPTHQRISAEPGFLGHLDRARFAAPTPTEHESMLLLQRARSWILHSRC